MCIRDSADADPQLPELRDFTLDRHIFSPNRDGIDDRVLMQFYLPKEVAALRVFVQLPEGGELPIAEQERDIPATQVKQMPVPEGSVTPAPLGVTNKNTGGGPAGAAPGVRGGVGVNNVGLLARAFGWVTAVVPDGFYINDGSNLASDGGKTGLKVSTTGLLSGRTIGIPEVGRYVTVTGAIGARQVEGIIYPVIRPRAQSDLLYEQARVSVDTLENLSLIHISEPTRPY